MISGGLPSAQCPGAASVCEPSGWRGVKRGFWGVKIKPVRKRISTYVKQLRSGRLFARAHKQAFLFRLSPGVTSELKKLRA